MNKRLGISDELDGLALCLANSIYDPAFPVVDLADSGGNLLFVYGENGGFVIHSKSLPL